MKIQKPLHIRKGKLNEINRHLRIKESDGFSMYFAKSLILRFLKTTSALPRRPLPIIYYFLFSLF